MERNSRPAGYHKWQSRSDTRGGAHQPQRSYNAPVTQHQGYQGSDYATDVRNYNSSWWRDELPSGGTSSNSSYYCDFSSSVNRGYYQQKSAENWGPVQYSRGPRKAPVNPVDKRTANSFNRKRDRFSSLLNKYDKGRSSSARSPMAKRRNIDEKLSTGAETSDTVSDKLSEQTNSIINDILRGVETVSSSDSNVTKAVTPLMSIASLSKDCSMRSKAGNVTGCPKTAQQPVTSKAPVLGSTSVKSRLGACDSTVIQALAPEDARARFSNLVLNTHNKNSKRTNGNVNLNVPNRPGSSSHGRHQWNGPAMVRNAARNDQVTDQSCAQKKSVPQLISHVVPRETDRDSGKTRCSSSNSERQSLVQTSARSPRQFVPVTNKSMDWSTSAKKPLLLQNPEYAIPKTKTPLLPNPGGELSIKNTTSISTGSCSSTAITNLIKVGSTPRSRREQIELEQMMREHASRKPPPKSTVPAHQRSVVPDSLNFHANDVVFTSVDQNEVGQEIGFDLSQLDENSDLAVNGDCVMIDDNSTRNVTGGGSHAAGYVQVAHRMDSDCILVSTEANDHGNSSSTQKNSTINGPRNNSSTISSRLSSSSLASTGESGRAHAKVSEGSMTLSQQNTMETAADASAECPPVLSDNAESATLVTGASGPTDHGSLTTVLQISLQEETVMKDLNECTCDIERIRMQVMTLKNQLETQLHRRMMLMAEGNRLRQARMQILQESVTGLRLSSNLVNTTAGEGAGSVGNVSFDVRDADNADSNNAEFFCDIQPIMIQPDADNESDGDCVISEADRAVIIPIASNSESLGDNVDAEVQSAGVQVLYCGTLAGNSLLAPGVLTELAQNLVAGFRSPQAVDYLTNLPSVGQVMQSHPSIEQHGQNSSRRVSVGSSQDMSLSDVEPDDCIISGCAQQQTSSPSAPVSVGTNNPVCSIVVLSDDVIYTSSDGCVFRQPLQCGDGGSFKSTIKERQVYRRHEGRVMCMHMTKVGTESEPVLITVGEDKRLVVVGYPIQAIKQTFTGIDCYQSNCIVQNAGVVYIGLRNGRVAMFTVRRSVKRRKMDIACGRGNMSHVSAIALAYKGSQRFLCIAVCDNNDILVRDAGTAKHCNKNLEGLPSPAQIMHGMNHWVISCSGNNEVHIHNIQPATTYMWQRSSSPLSSVLSKPLGAGIMRHSFHQNFSMEKTLTFSGPVASIVCRPRDKQILVADNSGTISWIGVKDGIRYTMFTQYDITALGCGANMVFIGCKDGEVHRIQYDSSAGLKCRYLHCKFMSWRSRDLKRHLINDHIEQIHAFAGDTNVVVCKWEACMEVISTDAKMMRRHFHQHVAAESKAAGK